MGKNRQGLLLSLLQSHRRCRFAAPSCSAVLLLVATHLTDQPPPTIPVIAVTLLYIYIILFLSIAMHAHSINGCI